MLDAVQIFASLIKQYYIPLLEGQVSNMYDLKHV